MNITSAGALAVCAVCAILYLKPQQKEIAVTVGIAAGVILFAASLSGMAEVIAVIRQAAENSAYSESIAVLLKSLGIAATVQLCADICREAGESTVGAQLELLGKIEILLLSLPLVAQLLSLTREILS